MEECKAPIGTIPGVKQVIGLPVGCIKWIYFGIALTVGRAISAVLRY